MWSMACTLDMMTNFNTQFFQGQKTNKAKTMTKRCIITNRGQGLVLSVSCQICIKYFLCQRNCLLFFFIFEGFCHLWFYSFSNFCNIFSQFCSFSFLFTLFLIVIFSLLFFYSSIHFLFSFLFFVGRIYKTNTFHIRSTLGM